MDTESYWARVHRRAFADTRRFLHLDTGSAIVTPALLFLIYVFLVWRFVSLDDARQELISQIFLTLAAVLFFPVVYLIYLIRTPNVLHKETSIKLENAELELSALKEPKAISEADVQEYSFGGNFEGHLDRTGATAIVLLRNRGSRAGAIPYWDMWVERNGDKITLGLVGGGVNLNSTDPGRRFSFRAEDQLIEKTRNPIEPGAYVQGHITGMSEPNMKLRAGDKLVVEFQDVFGSIGRTEQVFADADEQSHNYSSRRLSREHL